MAMAVQTRILSEALGVEVRNVDPAARLNGAAVAELHRLWLAYGIFLFCGVDWTAGDAILWENRCIQHRAMPFDEAKYQRHMQRTTLEGDAPYFTSARGARIASTRHLAPAST